MLTINNSSNNCTRSICMHQTQGFISVSFAIKCDMKWVSNAWIPVGVNKPKLYLVLLAVFQARFTNGINGLEPSIYFASESQNDLISISIVNSIYEINSRTKT
ncbi:MAG: hypothetical protein ACI8ZM_002223 [Crocinitomix sp.]|jgi:hypothetical protein